MAQRNNPLRTILGPSRIFIPVAIGLTAAAALLYYNFDVSAFSKLRWTWYSSAWLTMALLMMVLRDLAYMIRIRILTSKELSWRKAFDVILLWEFASAITPSIVGGAPIAIFIVNKEGIALGKSTAIVLLTSLLDELFFISIVPLLFYLLKDELLFNHNQFALFNFMAGAKFVFFSSYGLILLYCCLISYGIFVNPRGIKWVLIKFFKLPLLNKWKNIAIETGNEIVLAAQEVNRKPLLFWIQSMGATYLSWFARFAVVNCIIMAFLFTNEHVLIYARQMVMWIIMLISPTPGGSGIAEYAFSHYLGDFTPIGLEATLALVWRLISYYPYLFIGSIILPGWISRVYLKRKLVKFKSK